MGATGWAAIPLGVGRTPPPEVAEGGCQPGVTPSFFFCFLIYLYNFFY
jgi:hypothetical protein